MSAQFRIRNVKQALMAKTEMIAERQGPCDMGTSRMNTTKLRKTIYVAFFVSLAGQIPFSFYTAGFIVALSTIVMAIFIYCYEDLSTAYIACLSEIFSPLIRMLADIISGGDVSDIVLLILPDTIYFFSYAAIYTCIYRGIVCGPKTMKNFPYVIFFSDFLSNTVEMGTRSLMTWQNLYSIKIIAYLAAIALVRMLIIMIVVIVIESYGKLLINQEREREYRDLLTQASTVSGELRVMNKNIADVENVMK